MMNALRQVGSPINLWPAYGRAYRDAAAMLSAWEAGKDFSLTPGTGPYTSIRDLEALKAEASTVWLIQGNQRVRVA